MTLLVTGATGHVGGEIARQAALRGMRVIATYRGELRAAADSPVTWVRCDLADANAVRRLAEEHRIDACIHGQHRRNRKPARSRAARRVAPLRAGQHRIGVSARPRCHATDP
jgi:dTDP-4-dehydrorhamnose reductase